MKKTILLLLTLITTAYAGNPDYEAGYNAMQNQDWHQSYQFFKLAEKDKSLLHASQFWQGYVLFKQGKDAKAKRILKKLIKEHPDNRWTDDGKLLLLEHSKKKVDLNDVELDEELRLYAIQQIYFNNPEKGLPKLLDLLKVSSKKSTKMNALHILGISESDTALDALHKFIVKEKNEDLLNQAIQMLSLRNNKSSSKILVNLYKENKNKAIKRAIIHGFIHSNENKTLAGLLKNETDTDSRMHMINILGIKGAMTELKQFYTKSKNVDEKLAIMHALAIAGDGDFIIKSIENEDDPNIKSAAIHSMIIIDDENTEDYLVKLYKTNQNYETKQEIIQAFIAIDIDSDTILQLIEEVEIEEIVEETEVKEIEEQIEIKTSLLRVLMAKGDSQSLLKTYKNESNSQIKTRIIQHLGAMGANKDLMKLYGQSQREPQHEIVRALGMSSSTDSTTFLLQLFKTGESRMQQAVIQSFIMQDDTESLIKLLKQESDLDIKKQLIRAIGNTDSDALDEILN